MKEKEEGEDIDQGRRTTIKPNEEYVTKGEEEEKRKRKRKKIKQHGRSGGRERQE